ncbi:MAG: S9 family peptidase [Candidatus Kerfeldbacteria bacterium]|nr:S9 family peptidase [Candidatus Kerfeldbacteria bacterium]
MSSKPAEGFHERKRFRFDARAIRATVPGILPSTLALWRRRGAGLAVEEITYWSGRLRVRGFLVYPKRHRGKVPAIIYNRGGNEDFGQLTLHHVHSILAPLAEAGYVVIASQYRGVAGGDGREEYGGRDVQDVLNLIPCLRQLRFADTHRIGMYGWSRGGMMTYLALKKLRTIKAAVVGGGSSDLIASSRYRPNMLRNVYKKLIPAKGRRLVSAMKQRSAIYWPAKLAPKTPLLLLHGTADWRVRPTESIRMAEALMRLRRPVRLIVYEGADHGIHEHWQDVHRQTVAWFDRFLKHGERLPNMNPHGA